ncbi:hypothetical protein HID58_038030, partial [Brassica napus]
SMRLRDPEAFSSVMDGPRSGLLSLAGDKKCHCLQTLCCLVSFSLLSPSSCALNSGRTPVVTPHILSSIVFYRVIPEILFLCRGRSRDIKALHMPLKTLLVLHYLLSVLSDGFLMLVCWFLASSRVPWQGRLTSPASHYWDHPSELSPRLCSSSKLKLLAS